MSPSPAAVLVPGSELASALRRALQRAEAEQGRSALRVAWLSAPSGAARRLAAHRVGDHTVLWAAPGPDPDAPGSLSSFAGLGAAAVVQTHGPERLIEARRRIEAVHRADGRGANADSRLPRFWGGMSFAPRTSAGGCWDSFGEATFVLPRWNYEDTGREARLGVVYDPQREPPGQLIEEAEVLWRLLLEPPAAPTAPTPTAEVERRESTSPAEWAELVRAIRSGIERGVVHKVVAARRSTLRLSPAPDPALVFERLAELAPACHRFALRIGERTFLGATPERLVRRRGRRVDTQAIAGSIAADVEGAAEKLLASDKDRAEHEYVVAAIRGVLEPLCQRLDVLAQPSVRQLRHVMHLETPIRGVLQSDVHVLELVQRLHPTPAVGGVPTERALDWIARTEPVERGWYASPIGWVDAAGDGEMLVALRSALILADRTHLYAGAGIVAGSEASSEYAETEVKLAGMRAALGVGEPGDGHAAS